MVPLLILILVFCVFTLFNHLVFRKQWNWSFAGRLSMSIMLFFTGVAHFTNTGHMAAMIPELIPFKNEIVYLSGILEFVLAIGLLQYKWARASSVLLILFFLAVLPANIAGSLKSIPFGGMEKGPDYLYFRIPLQLFFIGWVYFFGIRMLNKQADGT